MASKKNVKKEVVEVEVVDKKELLTSEDYIELRKNYDDLISITNRIKAYLSDSVKNYLRIGYLLTLVTDEKLQECGCENIYVYAKENFGIGETTTKNFINVYHRFGNTDLLENKPSPANANDVYRVDLKDDYKDYSMTQLVELLPVKDEELNKYSPSLSVREIRVLKKQSQLTDFENDINEKVEKSFKDLMRKALFEVNDDFVREADDFVCEALNKKFTFSNKGDFSFKAKHKKVNLFFSISINNDFEGYSIQLGKSNNYYDCSWVDVKLSNDSDSLEQLIKKLNALFESVEKNKDDKLEKLLQKIKEKYISQEMLISDLFKGDFNDLYKLAKKAKKYYTISCLDSLRHLHIPYAIFEEKFKLEEFCEYNIELIKKVNDHLYLNVGTGVSASIRIVFRFYKSSESVEDGLYLTLKFEDLLAKYPDYLKNYDVHLSDYSSLFSIYFELAERWCDEKLKELENEKESSEEEFEDESEEESEAEED